MPVYMASSLVVNWWAMGFALLIICLLVVGLGRPDDDDYEADLSKGRK